MKQNKKLIRKHKELLEYRGLIPDNWFYERDTPEELVIVHRHTKTVKKLRKGV